jgi:hypothetical protein
VAEKVEGNSVMGLLHNKSRLAFAPFDLSRHPKRASHCRPLIPNTTIMHDLPHLDTGLKFSSTVCQESLAISGLTLTDVYCDL